MYKRSIQGWLKHIDFILLDVLALQLAFILAYAYRHGGMPYALSLSVEDKVKYLTELHKEIYLKDISERYGIFNSSGMDDLQKVLASAVSSLTNPQNAAGYYADFLLDFLY